MAKTGPQIEMAIERLSSLSQYVGDEVVISGSLNGDKPPSIVVLAEVRKPGLKMALEQAIQQLAGTTKPALVVVDQQGLASLAESKPQEMTVLVRQDYVIVASNLETLRNFNRQLDSGTREFASTPFGQRLQTNYNDGVAVLAGLDLQKILRQAPIPSQQGQMLRETGFGDVKYAIWEHKGVAAKAEGQAELSFTRPRRGIASWLAAPRDLGSLDFASPKAILVASIALKNLGDVFEDVRALASASNPNAFAQFDQMQQGLGLNLKDDLLSQLGGEITLEVDDVTDGQPAWKAILQVNDTARLQQTFSKLLATAPVSDKQFSESGVTYHSLMVPSAARSMEVGYAFVDGYLVIASSGDGVREAVRLHRGGGSLAKSSKFLAALPPGHSTQASALYYSDPLKTLGLQLARFSPQLAQSLPLNVGETKPVVVCAYGEESAIREASMSQGVDAGMVLVMAAVAIPNMLRAKNSANESAAVGSLRSMISAQASYSATYPARGYARDLSRLGVDPVHPDSVSPQHAGLLDSSFAKPSCTVGSWCEKSGYRFTFGPACPRLLCQEFVAIATPASASSGSRNFCATSDGVVRYRVGPLSNPLSADECRRWVPLQ